MWVSGEPPPTPPPVPSRPVPATAALPRPDARLFRGGIFGCFWLAVEPHGPSLMRPLQAGGASVSPQRRSGRVRSPPQNADLYEHARSLM